MRLYTMTKRYPEIDKHIGRRMRDLRELHGLSQYDIAGLAHVSYQQIQKYENGGNRISASTLYTLAITLQVDIDWFFEGLDIRHPGKQRQKK